MVSSTGKPESINHRRPLAVSAFTAADVPRLDGKTFVVTGANDGLGQQTALTLASKGARVLMACRNLGKAERAREAIAAAATGPEPVVVPCDLSDLESVRDAAAAIADHAPAVDVLINNAGVMNIPRRVTKQGFEMQLGVNHLGHFVLTGRLLPTLLAAPAPRVVTLASVAHRYGYLRLSDLQGQRFYQRTLAYGQSKLANLIFATELARRASQTPLISVASHPGFAATELYKSSVPAFAKGPFLAVMGRVANTVVEGARSELYAATMPDIVNGDYVGHRYELSGPVSLASRSRRSISPALGRKLWDRSVELTGEKFAALD